MMNTQFISVPTLLVDQAKAMRNIQKMADKAIAAGVTLRPHCKTHQSLGVGRWFRAAGIEKITVSSLRMAVYFAQDQWKDITVAFPVNIREMALINKLANTIQLNLVVENTAAIAFLSAHLTSPVALFIKADTGYHRTGLPLEASSTIQAIIQQIAANPMMRFAGFLAHAGHSYRAQGQEEVEGVHKTSLKALEGFRELMREYPNSLTYSTGDTPTCSLMNSFGVATEIRPGNFVFYDLSQWRIGSCQLEDIAVAMACPVVAKHEERMEIVVYGGGVHFSKDRSILPNGQTYYGMVATWQGDHWQPLGTENYVCSLSQEHGIVKVTRPVFEKTNIGALMYILPIHSCMAADLMKHYYALDGTRIDMMAY